MDLERGFHGNERFELRECLGEGSFGVVYRAYDKLRGRTVALKVLRNLGPDSVFYFKQEFRALSEIVHPNLVNYRELFEDRGRWFLSMDVVDGVTLREHVRGEQSGVGALEAAQLGPLREGLCGLAAALRTLHGAGKVHCDVKPRNVRVDEDGRAVLLDFGLVTDHGDVLRGPLGVSEGTAAYLAPEQVEGRPPSPAADWYAVGVLLYECLVGRPPFVGTPEQVLVDKCESPAPPLSAYASPIPEDLTQLCEQLLQREPEARRGAIARFERVVGQRPSTMPPPPLALPGHARFVGREQELEQLSELVMDHATPGLRLALVFGESGLGKTALLEELWTAVGERDPGVRVLKGRCFERETAPYNAFASVVDGLVALLDELPVPLAQRLLPEEVGPLLHAFPAFTELTCLPQARPAPLERPDASLRRRAFQRLRELLVKLALDTPLVVALDDVQWADADSLALLEAVFGGEGPPPCLLLCSGRTRPAASHAVSRVLRRLEQGARVCLHQHVRPLSEDESHALAVAELGGTADGDALAMQVARESGGHPLFVDALVRHLCELEGSELVSLSAALDEAYGQLGADAQRLAKVLALAPTPLDEGTAREASRLPAPSFARAQSTLAAAGWVRTRRAPSGARVALTHERMRMTVDAHLEAVERGELHWEIAQALCERDGLPEVIALHFAEAGDAERALQHALEGAQAALRGCAFAHAESLYLLALQHVPEHALHTRRSIELELARVHQLAGRGREAGDLYAELSRSRPGLEALELRYRAAEAWLDSGYYEEGLPWIQALLADLGKPIATHGLGARLRSAQARVESLLRRGTPAFRDDDELPAESRFRADALYKLTCALLASEPARSRAAQAQHLAYALRLGDPYRAARAFALEVWLRPQSARTRGHYGLDSNLEAARRLSHSSDAPHARALVHLAEGVLCLSDDRYAEATARLSEAAQQLAEHCPGARFERTYARYYRAICAWHVGEFSHVRESVEEALHDAGAQGDVLAESLWRSRLGHLPALLEGRPEAAGKALATVTGPAPSLPHAELHALLSKVEVDLYRNDPWAFDQIEARWEDIERAGSLRVRSTRRRVLWTRARAALCSARLDGERRSQLLRVALQMAARLAGDRTPAARTCAALVESASLELRGQRHRARDAYMRASALAESAGCWAMVATADARRAAIQGGEDGAALRERAHAYLRRAGAREPARMAAVLNGF